MVARRLQPQEYQAVQGWFQSHTGVLLPRQCLSDYGFVACDYTKLLACVFAYPAIGSEVCWLGWHIANPETKMRDSAVALDCVYKKAETFAYEAGYRIMMTYSKKPSIARRLGRSGYKAGDRDLVNLIKRLED